ncbi:hypothetical protein [Sphaerisporangium perillae]|uniref:hypothetical protein n=1 Tax=Sphaerisporangium perillae TaxID=2935860 RepID=UPI00200D2F5A|nr:hypothetical protein [Sphaerisporangium perillae]
MAEAETAPLPKITIEEPPPSPPPARRSLIARLGDLPMRVIYRIAVGGVATLAVVAAAVVFLVVDRGKPAPTAASALPASSPPAASSDPSDPSAPSASADFSASADPSASVDPSALASSAAPSAAASGTTAPGTSATSGASGPSAVSAQAGATPVPTPVPGRSALAAAEADPRVPAPPSVRKLADFPGRGAPTKGRVKDKRSGITFTRFTKAWKLVKSAPFGTRRVLPVVKGAGHRGMLATCPVPIAIQDELKDTAYLAARWTLNYHPDGSTITWTASQAIKAGKQKGWLLGYQVHYKVDGKKRVSTAAVALIDVPSAKPAMVFITIPDAQKKRRPDINTLISSLRVL